MQLFTRTVALVGPPAESTAYAVEMRQYVADLTGRDIALWAAAFGAPLGTMTYATRVEGLADLQSMSAPLLADAEYHKRLAAGQQFTGGPAVDNMMQPVGAELGAESPPVGAVAVVTTAVMSGNYGEAAAWGVDIANHVSQVSKMPTMFLTGAWGAFGSVGWIGVALDAAAADAASAAIEADAAYLEKLNAGAGYFMPGSGHRTMLTRVA